MYKYLSKAIFYIFILCMCLPIIFILWHSTHANYVVWQHLVRYVMFEYVYTSFFLVLGVLVLSALIGMPLAWLMSRYTFKYQALCHWVLILPLAIPSYILAYAYTDFLQFSGPVQTFLRSILPNFKITDVRSLGFAIIIFSINLYPYVYLMCYAAFKSCNQHIFEVAQIMGEKKIFFNVGLSLIRPTLFAALSLIAMEVLSDYGTVSYFGLQTFSLGIYRSWLELDDKPTAMLLCSILILFIILLIYIEVQSRKKQKFYTSKQYISVLQHPLNKVYYVYVWFCVGVFLIFGLLLPVCIMLKLFFSTHGFIGAFKAYNWLNYLQWLKNTVYVAAISSTLTVIIAFILNVFFKAHQRLNLAAFGYAMPGTMLAISILSSVHFFSTYMPILTTYLSSSLWLIIYAYFIRFYAIAHKNISNNYIQISPNLGDVAQLLGLKKWQLLFKVYWPLLRNSLLASFLLVGIDSVKELPSTLLLRPFNFDTLAVISYQFARDERLEELALPALTIIILSLLPMLLIYSKEFNKKA
jgi:iron(III) transport system permease protein